MRGDPRCRRGIAHRREKFNDPKSVAAKHILLECLSGEHLHSVRVGVQCCGKAEDKPAHKESHHGAKHLTKWGPF